MPWIVVIPLGLMVIGMGAMFTWQFTHKPKYPTTSVAGPAGVWLIFLALIEGSIGVGMAVGESRADGSFGGFGMAAVALLGTAIVLLVVGLALTSRSIKLRRVAEK